MRRWAQWTGVLTLGVAVVYVEWQRSKDLASKSEEVAGLSERVGALSSELARSRQLNASFARRRCALPPPEQKTTELRFTETPPRPHAEANSGAEEGAPVRGEPVLISVPSLDDRLLREDIDEEWQSAVHSSASDVLGGFDDAEVISTRCSKNVCRVEFTTGTTEGAVEDIMEALNNIPEVEGERLIQVDDSTSPAFATAYFGRDAATSLAQR